MIWAHTDFPSITGRKTFNIARFIKTVVFVQKLTAHHLNVVRWEAASKKMITRACELRASYNSSPLPVLGVLQPLNSTVSRGFHRYFNSHPSNSMRGRKQKTEERAPGIFYAATASIMVWMRTSNSYHALVQAIHRPTDAFPKASVTYRVSQEECATLREDVPYVKVYRYNPKHLCPNLNGYGDNGHRSLKLWQLLHT